MTTYYIGKNARGWFVALAPDASPMPGGIFKTRKQAVTTAALLAGWKGKVVLLPLSKHVRPEA